MKSFSLTALALRKVFPVLACAAVLSACLLNSEESGKSGEPGYVKLRIDLDRSAGVLGKSATADTIFNLDSIKVVLTAQGAATQVWSYPLSGRPDTGEIFAGTGVYQLAPLRTWKAKIFTIDTTLNPTRSDTVHLDSISFAVRAGDTLSLSKTVSAAYASLRVRLLSTSGDSLLASIAYLRVRINGVTRDSIFPNGATYNGVYFADLKTAWAVSDSGWIYKTSDSGTTWLPQVSGVANDLKGTWFVNTSFGTIVGTSGTILRTTNGGTNWVPRASGTLADLRKVAFGTVAKGYVVGDSGTILKTIDTGNTWFRISGGWFSQSSGTPEDLNAVHFKSPDSGFAVANNGVYLRTFNSGNTWSAVATPSSSRALNGVQGLGTNVWVVGDSGLIWRSTNLGTNWTTPASNVTYPLGSVRFFNATTGWAVGNRETILKTTDGGVTWASQSGGWMQSLDSTSANLNGVSMGTGAVGWAVGDGGVITKTTNGGLTWTSPLTSGTANLMAVSAFDANRAWAVGDGGTIRHSNTTGTAWHTHASPLGRDLNKVEFASATVGWAVGDSETILRTTDSINWRPRNGSWTTKTVSPANNLNMLQLFGRDSLWAVADGGKIYRSTDSGNSWSAYTTTKTRPLRNISFSTALIGVAVGDSGIIQRTADGGVNWGVVSSAVAPTKTLNGVSLPSTVGYIAGDTNTVLRSTDAGATWAALATPPTGHWNDVFYRTAATAAVTLVGDGGKIARATTNLTSGTPAWSTLTVGSSDLNSVFFTSSTVGYAVGNGGTILKTVNSGTAWTARTSGTTEDLKSVFFKGTGAATDTGYAVGTNGTILRTLDSGKTWIKQYSGTTATLKGVAVRPGADTAYVVGGGGLVLKTRDGGLSLFSGKGTPQHYRGLEVVGANNAWIVGDSGTILRTMTGNTWELKNSGIGGSVRLNSVVFKNATTGWVVGDGGKIYKTADSISWADQSGNVSPATTVNLYHVRVKAGSDTVWAAGENGTILYTTNGGTNWVQQSTEVNTALNALFPRSKDTVVTVGAGGVALKTITGGRVRSGKGAPVNLHAVTATSASVAYAAGDSSVVLKTTDGGATWAAQAPAGTSSLNGLAFRGNGTTDTGWAAASGGKIFRTLNGGTLWSLMTTLPSDLYSVTVAGAAAFVSGANGLVYVSKDRGVNWTAQSSGVSAGLNGIYAANVDTVFTVGAGGILLKTRDTGIAVTSQDLNSVHFVGDTGYVVGTGGAAFRSTNGGTSWIPITGATANLNDVFFSKQASNYTYAVGDSGTLLEVNLSATAWTSRPSGTNRRLNATHVAGAPRLYIVGDSGIVRTQTTFPLPASPTWTPQPTKTTESLRAMNCFPLQDTCLFVGTNESVVKTDDGASVVYVFKSSGARRFDKVLTYKYLRTGQANIINLQAIDRPSPLRGFEFTDTLTLGAGQDTTLDIRLKKCGGTSAACTP